MELSLGETETLVTRATRGFGLSWGLAQEAGRAASALAAFGFPAVDLFDDLFRLSAGLSYEQRRPLVSGSNWSAPGPALCPVILGSSISDRRRELITPGASPLTTGAVYCPLIVVAMLVPSAGELDEALHFEWGAASLWLAGDRIQMPRSTGLATDTLVSEITLTSEPVEPRMSGAGQTLHAEKTRSQARRDSHDALSALAQLTYVPSGSEPGSIDARIQAD